MTTKAVFVVGTAGDVDTGLIARAAVAAGIDRWAGWSTASGHDEAAAIVDALATAGNTDRVVIVPVPVGADLEGIVAAIDAASDAAGGAP